MLSKISRVLRKLLILDLRSELSAGSMHLFHKNIARQSIIVRLQSYGHLKPQPKKSSQFIRQIISFVFSPPIFYIVCWMPSRFSMTVHEWLPPAVYGILSTTVAIQIFMSTKRQVYRQQNPVMSQKEKILWFKSYSTCFTLDMVWLDQLWKWDQITAINSTPAMIDALMRVENIAMCTIVHCRRLHTVAD